MDCEWLPESIRDGDAGGCFHLWSLIILLHFTYSICPPNTEQDAAEAGNLYLERRRHSGICGFVVIL